MKINQPEIIEGQSGFPLNGFRDNRLIFAGLHKGFDRIAEPDGDADGFKFRLKVFETAFSSCGVFPKSGYCRPETDTEMITFLPAAILQKTDSTEKTWSVTELLESPDPLAGEPLAERNEAMRQVVMMALEGGPTFPKRPA